MRVTVIQDNSASKCNELRYMNNDNDMIQNNSATKCNKLRYKPSTRIRNNQKKPIKGFKFPFKQYATKLVSFMRKLYSALPNLKNFNNQAFIPHLTFADNA